MARTAQLAITSALSWALLAPGAFADLTGAEVWGDWRDYMSDLGYDLQATETADGDKLTVSDIQVNVDLGAEGGAMKMTMGPMTFVDADDGTVDVVMPDTMPVTLTLQPPENRKPAIINISYVQSGHTLKVSGDPQKLTSAYASDSASIALDSMVVDGVDFTDSTARFNMSTNNLASTTVMTIGDLRTYDQTMSADGMQYDVFFKSPTGPEQFEIKGQLDKMEFEGSSAIPVGVAMSAADTSAMLAAGFAGGGTFRFGPGAYTASVVDPNGPVNIMGSSDGGDLSVMMDAEALRYGANQSNLKVDMQVPDVPFPISFSLGGSGFNLLMPVQKSDAPKDFALGFNMTDFQTADGLWALLDPTGQLPRDPATIALDLTGQVKVLVDLFSPSAAEQMAQPGAVPGSIETLKINNLLVDAVGAKLTGAGAFAFDNTDTVTVPGMPKPVGSIELNVEGANALIDRLIAMGILPEDQAMGARMMMGMLAVPGDAPDTLSSKIEMTADGQILANGQRIK